MTLARLWPALPIFRTRAFQALLEIGVLQLLITLLWPLAMLIYPHVFAQREAVDIAVYRAEVTTFFFALYCLTSSGVSTLWLLFRWRLRPLKRSRWLQLLIELVLSAALSIECILIIDLLALTLGRWGPFVFLHPPAIPTDAHLSQIFNGPAIPRTYLIANYIIPLLCGCTFIFLRAGVYVFLFWNRLRQSHLRWALTHAHLLVVVIGAGIVYLIVVISSVPRIMGQSGFSVTAVLNPFLYSLVILCFVLFLTGIGIALVLPPSALFSYLFARHMTRRIEKLARATSALRNGDYHVRVMVEGEDEIARLQTDFNAMATDLERTMHELQEERDTVARLLLARRELIASVSHELRTPVATVRSYLESTLSTWGEQSPQTLRQDLQTMEQQTVRLQALINDLFTLARAEVGQLEMRCLPTNLEVLLLRVAEMMAPLVWRGSKIELVADLAPDLPAALVDESRLEQVVQNLLHNAVRHTPPGGIIVVSASFDETVQMVALQVKDTGEGIAPEELARIWERFYRAENARSRSGSGSGLGLAIVKELTETMGGHVNVSSVVGEGTCFTLHLPLASEVSPDVDTVLSSLSQLRHWE